MSDNYVVFSVKVSPVNRGSLLNNIFKKVSDYSQSFFFTIFQGNADNFMILHLSWWFSSRFWVNFDSCFCLHPFIVYNYWDKIICL